MNKLTTAQAANALGVSVRTIARWVQEGRLSPALRLDGTRGAMWFDRAEVERVRQARAA